MGSRGWARKGLKVQDSAWLRFWGWFFIFEICFSLCKDVLQSYPEPCILPWLAGNEGMDKKIEATTMGYIGTTKDPFLHS